jgi:hypothetical protein
MPPYSLSLSLARCFCVSQPETLSSLSACSTTCLYLACKTEEQRIAASDLCRRMKSDAKQVAALTKSVLNLEMTLLTALHFSLFVHHPQTCLSGLLHAFVEWLDKSQTLQDQHLQLLDANSSTLIQTRSKALELVSKPVLQVLDQQYASDLVLLASPALIALAALHHVATSKWPAAIIVRHVVCHHASMLVAVAHPSTS